MADPVERIERIYPGFGGEYVFTDGAQPPHFVFIDFETDPMAIDNLVIGHHDAKVIVSAHGPISKMELDQERFLSRVIARDVIAALAAITSGREVDYSSRYQVHHAALRFEPRGEQRDEIALATAKHVFYIATFAENAD